MANQENQAQNPVRFEVTLYGDEAKQFLHYQQKEKLRTKAQAAYKLITESLEKISTPETNSVSVWYCPVADWKRTVIGVGNFSRPILKRLNPGEVCFVANFFKSKLWFQSFENQFLWLAGASHSAENDLISRFPLPRFHADRVRAGSDFGKLKRVERQSRNTSTLFENQGEINASGS